MTWVRMYSRHAPWLLASLATSVILSSAGAVGPVSRSGARADSSSRRLPPPAVTHSDVVSRRSYGGGAASPTFAMVVIELRTPQDAAGFQLPGVTVFGSGGRFVDAFVAQDPGSGDRPDFKQADWALNQDPRVQCYEWEGSVSLPPVPRISGTARRGVGREDIAQDVQDLGATGKGVLIGIIDSGVDFRRGAFVRAGNDGGPESRIARMWDMSGRMNELPGECSRPPVQFPDGTPVGAIYTREHLTHSLRAPQSTHIPATDLDGHGTACAGIAASNGSEEPDNPVMHGVAPDADLLVVRLKTEADGPLQMGLYNAALRWMDAVASEMHRPLVISTSLGKKMSPHDGSALLEGEMDALFPSSRVGRSLVVAAGNEGDKAYHARVVLGPGENQADLMWVDVDSTGQQYLEVYGARDAGDVMVQAWAGDAPGRVLEKYRDCRSGNSMWSCYGSALRGGLRFAGGVVPETLDVYVSGAHFTDHTERERTLSCPSTARCVLSVGSYDFNSDFQQFGQTDHQVFRVQCWSAAVEPMNLGSVSCYSSTGPSRDGRTKPDLVAPGQYWTACLAQNAMGRPVLGQQELWEMSGSGKGRLFNGTSAATPYVAGVVALMFELNPNLTLGEVQNQFRLRLTRSGDRSAWGYGKLDLSAVRRVLDSIRG